MTIARSTKHSCARGEQRTMTEIKLSRRIRRREFAELLGISIATFDRRVKDGTIPKPDYVSGPRCPTWPMPVVRNILGAVTGAA